MSKCIKSKASRERKSSLVKLFVEPSLLRLLCMSPTTPSCPPLLHNPGHCTCLWMCLLYTFIHLRRVPKASPAVRRLLPSLFGSP